MQYSNLNLSCSFAYLAYKMSHISGQTSNLGLCHVTVEILSYSFNMEKYVQQIDDQMNLRVECTFFERQLTKYKGLY